MSSVICAVVKWPLSKLWFTYGAGLLHEGGVIYKLCFTVVMSVSDIRIE